jgi:hypothetical protein
MWYMLPRHRQECLCLSEGARGASALRSGCKPYASSSLMGLAPLSTMRMGRPMGVLFCLL